MKAQLLLKTGAFIGVFLGLASAYYYGQTPRPYQFTEVQFCPVTANNRPMKHYDDPAQSQSALDNKYCRFKYRLLTEVWNSRQFNELASLPEDAFIVKDLAPSANTSLWLLTAPALVWMGYYCWAEKDEIDNSESFQRLEDFKTIIKRQGLVTRTERDLQSHESERIKDKHKKDIDRRADNQLVEEGYISLDELQTQYQRQAELEDLQFNNTKKQFAVADSVADKTVALNIRDKAKADQERSKIEGKTKDVSADSNSNQSVNQQRANELIQALKTHEDGWLWKIIDNLTPLWLIGRQGSGKTYTSAAIALVRKHCLGISIYYLIDRHATGDNSKAWRYLDTQNIAESEPDISTALDTLCEHWLLRIKGKNDLEQPTQIMPEQVLIDEYTNLKSLIGEPAENFYKLHLTDTRKAKVYVTGITHNDTNSSYPEKTQAMREAGTVLIQKFSANGKTPLPRVKILRGLLDDNGEELKDAERTLPCWFNPEDIYNHFNGKPIDFDG
ncbi:hypothetical protein NIES22_72840 (plasmid) [Calothrix brevissima NIES-22]|nr:hypothetical protein NIES22_72840 [Calothrix brevissima NIES-22]